MENKHHLKIKESDDGKFWDISGYAVLFDVQDLLGDTFTKNTDFWDGMTSETPPLLFDHGMDAKIGLSFVGQVRKKVKDEVGIWFEAQMDRANKYADAIAQMIRSHRMGVSTGTSPHTLAVADGFVTSWPILEISLTPTPAEPKTIGSLSQKSLALPVTDIFEAEKFVSDKDLLDGLRKLYEAISVGPVDDAAIKAHLGLARSVLAAVVSTDTPPAATGDKPAAATEEPGLRLEIEIEQFRHSHSAVTYK